MYAEEQEKIDATLVEMTYAWMDIEQELAANFFRPVGAPEGDAFSLAFRVEAIEGENSFGDPHTVFELLYDAEDAKARAAAREVRAMESTINSTVNRLVKVIDHRHTHTVRTVPRSHPIQGLVCGRRDQPPPKDHVDVTDIPVEKPGGRAPLVQKDGYWLTPIELPFYDALRETGAIFAVQPWIQGISDRFRPDFMVFYDGGTVIVELDGHEYHKSKEQRMKDAKKDRWFMGRGMKVLRWTGSEVHANPQECVRQLLEAIRGTQGRY